MNAAKLALFFLFGLSGFAGLIYESLWCQYIKLILGHAAYAQSLVLTLFMGGMALGAWLISRITDAIAEPLRWYALIEAIIGVFGITYHQEFQWFHSLLFHHALPLAETQAVAVAMKWGTATLLLLPQAILLGTTFPLMSAGVIRMDTRQSGHTLSMLYFTNSIGAAIGALVSAFLLIETVGLPGTGLTAGIINVLLAAGVWLLPRQLGPAPAAAAPASLEAARAPAALFLWVALLTGTASFFYEIGWIRMLSLVLGSSVQAFELMLSAFIMGLALGSFFIRRNADTLRNPAMALACIQISMGVLATATLPLYTASFSFMGFLVEGLSKTDAGFTLFNVSSHLIAIAVMLPATFMAGMTLPLITNILLRSGAREAAIGRVYAANTLGAIAGILLAMHWVMPALGVKSVVVLGGITDISVGILLLVALARTPRLRWRHAIAVAGAAVAVLLFAFTPFDRSVLSSGVYRFGKTTLSDRSRPVFYRDGKTATIAFIRSPGGDMSIRTNGKTDALIAPLDKPYSADEITMVMAATLPLALKPDAKHIANIGMGSGLTTHALLAADTVVAVDTIEIEHCMVEGARGFGKRVERAFTDPRSIIHIDDAKSFFSNRRKRYDVIVSEPSNPSVSGVASLFSAEFYATIQSHLHRDGIFVQWLQLYETDLHNVASVIKALDRAFVHFRVYNTDNTNLLIVASDGNPLDTLNPWIFEHAGLRDELRRVGIETTADLSVRYIGDKRRLAPLFASIGAPMNSDFFPYLGYRAPKSRFKQENAAALSWLHDAPVPVLNWLNGRHGVERVSARGRFFSFYPNRAQARAVADDAANAIGNEKLRFSVEILKKGPAGVGEDTVAESLQTVAASINPYLSAGRLSRYWSALTDRFEVAGASPRLRHWLEVHHAVSQLDAASTIAHASRLLAEGTTLSDAQREYLLTALFTAYVSENRYREAWQAAGSWLGARPLPSQPLHIRFLLALVADGLRRDAPPTARATSRPGPHPS